MPRIKAFDGYLVNPDRAVEVVSPAYDAVPPSERRRFAEAHPDNFLNTMRLQEDFDPEAVPGADELLAMNRRKLEQLLGDGSFREMDGPCMFIYRLATDSHRQTGVVCEVPVEEYEQGHLRIHEKTLSEKEDLLAGYLSVVGVSSSPICMTYPHDDTINDFLRERISAPPAIEFTSEDGVRQTIWCIKDPAGQQRLSDLFAGIEVTYLTDGHHRAASGRRYAEIMRESHGNRGDEPYNQLLVALFSDMELNVLPFHRCVRDLNGLSEEQLVAALGQDFHVEALDGVHSFEPATRGEFGMLVNHHWYRLVVDADSVDQDDPVASLDVSILQDRILEPILGIQDSRSDPRLGYFSGASDDEGLHARCREGWAVCFACHATSIEELMDVADAGGLMPPKSTYFDPKARSGIFVRRR